MPEILEDADNGLPHTSRELFARLYAHFKELDCQVYELERQIKACHRDDPSSRRLEAIPGVGPLSASALAASIVCVVAVSTRQEQPSIRANQEVASGKTLNAPYWGLNGPPAA
jgi:transposase